MKAGEHVFPRNLGGVKTIPNVCTHCNNTVLSQLDEELRTRSALAPVAAEELGTKIGLSWDVVKTHGNMLLEAHPFRVDGQMKIWPQLILDRGQLQQWGDEEDEERASSGALGRALIRRIKSAYEKWNCLGHSREFTLENLKNQVDLMDGNRYPPRVYLRERIWEFSKRSHFRLSYTNDYDLRKMLLELSKLDRGMTFNTRERLLGSFTPLIAREWYPRIIARALLKIAMNLMSQGLGGEFVNYRTFPEAIDFVLYDKPMEQRFLKGLGFVKPSDLKALHHQNKGHAARILNYNSFWVCMMSFFGGRIGAAAAFPGPYHPEIRTINFSMALKSSAWEQKASCILQEIQFGVVNDPKLINPTYPLFNAKTAMVGMPRSKNPMKRKKRD